MFRSKREVLATIKKRTMVKDGANYTIYDAFLGRDPVSGKKRRVAKSDLDELKKYITDFYKQLEKQGEISVQMTRDQIADASNALGLLEESGLKMSLRDVVKAYLDGESLKAKNACTETLASAWGKFSESISARSLAYRKCVSSRIGAFVTNVGGDMNLADVTAAMVKEDLMRRVYRKEDMGSWKTYNNILGDLKTFFGWCASSEQGFLEKNPLAEMKRLEIGYRQPEYMKAEPVAKLFAELEAHKADRPQDLADAILSFFCGMRAIEVNRVRLGEEAVKISLEDKFIRVIKCKGSERGIKPRAFTIPDQALAWMRSFDFLAAVRTPNGKFRQHLNEYAKNIGVKVPENAGRHTFITMFEAVHHDESKLSAIVGNTEGVRSRCYNGVETAAEGRAYFAIMPKDQNSDSSIPD